MYYSQNRCVKIQNVWSKETEVMSTKTHICVSFINLLRGIALSILGPFGYSASNTSHLFSFQSFDLYLMMVVPQTLLRNKLETYIFIFITITIFIPLLVVY